MMFNRAFASLCAYQNVGYKKKLSFFRIVTTKDVFFEFNVSTVLVLRLLK